MPQLLPKKMEGKKMLDDENQWQAVIHETQLFHMYFLPTSKLLFRPSSHSFP